MYRFIKYAAIGATSAVVVLFTSLSVAQETTNSIRLRNLIELRESGAEKLKETQQTLAELRDELLRIDGAIQALTAVVEDETTGSAKLEK